MAVACCLNLKSLVKAVNRLATAIEKQTPPVKNHIIQIPLGPVTEIKEDKEK